jgi:hypothetical protein
MLTVLQASYHFPLFAGLRQVFSVFSIRYLLEALL